MSRSFRSYMLVVLCLGAFSSSAQQGSVEIIGADELDKRIAEKVEAYDSTELDGYRIQLFFGADMNNAQKVKEKFRSLYPDMYYQVYMPYSQPYWRVRVGNFYSQLEAQPMLRKLEEDFESVFLVKEKIERPPLR